MHPSTLLSGACRTGASRADVEAATSASTSGAASLLNCFCAAVSAARASNRLHSIRSSGCSRTAALVGADPRHSVGANLVCEKAGNGGTGEKEGSRDIAAFARLDHDPSMQDTRTDNESCLHSATAATTYQGDTKDQGSPGRRHNLPRLQCRAGCPCTLGWTSAQWSRFHALALASP